MRILLSGSTGFLGFHLKRRLERDGHDVRCHFRHNSVSYIKADQLEVVINCAAELDRAEEMGKANVGLTLDLLETARQNGCSKFVQIGSSSELGAMEGPRVESDSGTPTNLYEVTKLAATNLTLAYAQYLGLNAVVARPFTLYGPNDKPRKMLPALWRAYRENLPFSCFCGGHDWLHVNDFTEGIVKLLHAPYEVTKGQIFHFGTGQSTSNEEIVRLFEGAVGGKLDVVYHTGRFRPYDVEDWRADWSKAKAQLGWEPKISIEEGIVRFVKEQT